MTHLSSMKKLNMTKLINSLFLLASVAGAVSCTPVKRGEYASGSATIYCDDGFKNILDEEIEVFEYTYPESSIIPFYVSERGGDRHPDV